MADQKFGDEVRNNEPEPALPGGNERPSGRVDLERFPAIRRRQQLNTLLLRRACTGTEAEPLAFDAEDFALLYQMARERDRMAIRRCVRRPSPRWASSAASKPWRRWPRSLLQPGSMKQSASKRWQRWHACRRKPRPHCSAAI